MTPRERVMAAVSHRATDFVPYMLPIEGEPAGRLDAHYGGPSWRQRIVNHYVVAAPDWGYRSDAVEPYTDKYGTTWQGPNIFHPAQPEPQDLYALKRRYGRHVTFDGGIGCQQLLPRGTPDQIGAEIARLCRELGQDGGFILGPTKPIMRDVPTANAVACVEAILGQANALE